MKHAADHHIDALFRSVLVDRAETLASVALDESEMLTRLTAAIARRRTRRLAALLLAAAMVVGLTGAIALAGSAPRPPTVVDESPAANVAPDATLRRVGREIGFTFVVPDGVTFEVYDEFNVEPSDAPSGWVAFTDGGPGPYGYIESRQSSQFVPGTRGVVVAEVTGAVLLHGEADPDFRDDPRGFLTDLDAKSVFVVEDIRTARLGGLEALSGYVTLERNWYSHLDLPDATVSVDFHHPSSVVVAEVGDALVLVQVWAETREELDAWLPIAMEFVDSIRFTHVSAGDRR